MEGEGRCTPSPVEGRVRGDGTGEEGAAGEDPETSPDPPVEREPLTDDPSPTKEP
jgi:hypothetical protein